MHCYMRTVVIAAIDVCTSILEEEEGRSEEQQQVEHTCTCTVICHQLHWQKWQWQMGDEVDTAIYQD